MHIRPMYRTDISRVADIAVSCFATDELFTWLCPQHAKYPDDMRRFQVLRAKQRLAEPGGHALVCVVDGADARPGLERGKCGADDDDVEGGEIVVGYAFWNREGGRQGEEDTWGRRLERTLLSLSLWYEACFLDRSTSQSRLAVYNAATDFAFYDAMGEYYHLSVLAVDPRFQHRGLGTSLVQWGLERARAEGVPVTVEASWAGRKLYESLGFRVFEQARVHEGLDAAALMWEPERRRGTWLMEGEDGQAMLRGKVGKPEDLR